MEHLELHRLSIEPAGVGASAAREAPYEVAVEHAPGCKERGACRERGVLQPANNSEHSTGVWELWEEAHGEESRRRGGEVPALQCNAF